MPNALGIKTGGTTLKKVKKKPAQSAEDKAASDARMSVINATAEAKKRAKSRKEFQARQRSEAKRKERLEKERKAREKS